MRAVLPLLLVLVLGPVTASAATVNEIVALSKAGVSDEVILALIERDDTIFSIDADQLVALTREGVSEAVIVAMLRSGRHQKPVAQTTSEPAEPRSAPIVYPTEPTVVIVGQTPAERQQANAPPPAVYFMPFPFAVGPSPTRCAVSQNLVQQPRIQSQTASFGHFLSIPEAQLRYSPGASPAASPPVVIDCPGEPFRSIRPPHRRR